jgi:hypothetical protein
MISYVEGLTDDALSDQFGLLFPEGIPGGGDGNLLKLRMDQAFDEPEATVGEYDINYEGVKITKTGSEETTKSFQMSFRVDINFRVYKGLKDWYRLVFNPDTGAVGSEEETRTTMILNAYGPPNKTIKYSKRYNGIKLKGFKPTAWDPNNKAEPIRVEATFIYASVDELTT